jgi:hypothetical protein
LKGFFMRELSTLECDQAGGGGITVDAKGTVKATAGTTYVGADGSVTITTNDGWTYERSGIQWTVTNARGEMTDCAMLHWLKYSDVSR